MAILIGASGSDRDEQFKDMVNFVKNLIANVAVSRQSVSVGLVPYGKTASIAHKLSDPMSRFDLLNTLSKLQLPLDGLDMPTLVNLVRKHFFSELNGARPDVAKTVLLFTTKSIGVDNSIRLLKKDGIQLIVVAYGSDIEPVAITSLVNKKEHLFLPETKVELDGKLTAVIKQLMTPGIETFPNTFYSCLVYLK